MIKTVTLGEATDRLGLTPEHVDALSTLGGILHLDLHADLVLPSALVRFVEGFLDGFDREGLGLRAKALPRWLPLRPARKYLRVTKEELEELIDQGEVETRAIGDLSDDEVRGVLQGLEAFFAVAGKHKWEDRAKHLLQSLVAKRGDLDATTSALRRKIACAFGGGDQVLGTDSVRKLRRRSARRPSSPEAEE